jgi:hypothetical protein
MFPICEPTLSFAEISEYWAAELNISWKRVQALLESAWWLGEILGEPGRPTRLELLKSLFKRMRDRDFPQLLFITPDSKPPAKTVEQPDGSLLINLRRCVPVPSDEIETWSDAACIQAFQAMAQLPSSEYYPEYLPGFEARKLTSNEFFKWIAFRDFPYPTFWKRTNHEAASIKLRRAQDRVIEDEVLRVYDIADKEGTKPPNIKEVVKPVQARLRQIGQAASATQIRKIAESPEFKKRRRLPGKTLSSEKRHPRE